MASNVEDVMEEVISDLRKYDDAKLIDKNKVYRDIVFGLKRFGNDVAELTETVVEVKNGRGVVPDSFFSLYAAYGCKPAYYKANNVEVNHLQSSHFFRERVEYSSVWNECNTCCEDKTEKVIRENVYFSQNRVEFVFREPKLLTLGKSMVRNNCHKQCRNFGIKDNPNEITIEGTTLSTNFDEGYIYMQYYGLPMDDEGRIDIPETKNGHLETYLEYYAKRRLAERLLANNDAQGLSNLYSVFRQEEQISLRLASANVKMSRINPHRLKSRLQRLNKSETLAYEAANIEHIFG